VLLALRVAVRSRRDEAEHHRAQATRERQRLARQQEPEEVVAVGPEPLAHLRERDHRQHDEDRGERHRVGRDDHPAVHHLTPEPTPLQAHRTLAGTESRDMGSRLDADGSDHYRMV
jgi:hypothetical protein